MWLSAAAWFFLRGSASLGSMKKEVPQGSWLVPQISAEILILWVTSEIEANLKPPYYPLYLTALVPGRLVIEFAKVSFAL